MKEKMVLLLMLCPALAPIAQVKELRKEIKEIVATSHGKVGIAILGPTTVDTLSFFGNDSFPMQSVFKFPLAMAILDRIDKGNLALDQKIRLTKKNLLPDTYSPLREKYPNGGVEVSLRDILGATVSQSDNNGCDILFRLLGGTNVLEKYVHALGVNAISVKATEEEMHKDWNTQYTDTSTPLAMAQMLSIFLQGKSLSKSSNDLLWKMMVETTTGADRIKGMLPAGAVVAHKTGTGNTNDKGILSASNDAGIIALPNGKYLIVVIFITDTTDTPLQCATIMARIARAAWENFGFIRE